jgi:hypothetical protein
MSILKFWNDVSSEWMPISTSVALLDSSVSNDKLGSDVKVGSLSALQTSAKGNAVSAINEVNSKVGNTAQLQTEAKTSVVSAVNELHSQIGGISNYSIVAGNGTFAGDEGQIITFSEAMLNTAYKIAVTQTGAVDGSVGDVVVADKTTAGFTVKNTGSSGGTFDWLAIA